MSDADREAFEGVKKAFAENRAWFQTMCSQKMDGQIAEHFWQAARDHYAPKLTENVPLAEENRRLREAIHPRPETKGTAPLILYFATEPEREEFIELYRQVRPGARSYKV